MTVQICRTAAGATGRYAEKELAQYIRKYSGAGFEGEPDLCFRLETDGSLAAHCYGWETSGRTITLRGGSESALLCCVYALLSEMGVCFTAEGDCLKGPFRLDAAAGSRSFAPYCRSRGIRQHINFPMDISSYSLGEVKEYIRRLARMRMNAITFHSYNGQWHPYRKDGQRVPAGHFFYGQRHFLPSRPETAAAIQNRRAFCIPEAEGILDEPEKREQFAVYWLNEVMAAAKEAGMRVTMSVECQELTPLAEEQEMLREVLRLYPQIDVIELITPEGGGDDSRTLTAEEALALSERLFGKEVTDSALAALSRGGNLPYGGTPTYALDGTLRSVKQIWRMWESRGEWMGDFPGTELQVGLYVTCKETLRAAKEIMNRIFPADLRYTFLPAHGALAVAEAVRHMGLTDAELQKTMLYSWIEFDGNMYLQQNSCGGIQKLLEFCRETSPGSSIYGICFNHWRTAENSLTISYAAEACHTCQPASDFYRQYAADHGIGAPEQFEELMGKLAELDVYNRDNLFNVGFCYLGCWLNPKGLGWTRGWTAEALAESIRGYERLIRKIRGCLAETESTEGLRRLRLWENRCMCSIAHLRAISELNHIAQFADDARPELLTDAQRKLVQEHCARALEYCAAYEKRHLEEMPDRGCEGTIVSYCATIPVYIDHVLQYFACHACHACAACGGKNCPHHPVSLDAPPPPDTAFFH